MFVARILTVMCCIWLTACADRQDTAESTDINPVTSDAETAGASGKVSVVITDDLTANYTEVWISLYQIEATQTGGVNAVIFQNSQGLPVNLTQLHGVGDLLSVAHVPVGDYDSFRVTLGRQLKLVTPDGQVRTREFASSGNAATITLTVKGMLNVAEDMPASFALDFDLKSFLFDISGKVVPAVVFVKEVLQDLRQTSACLQGEIVALDGADFTLKTGDGVEVQVHSSDAAIYVGEDDAIIDLLEIGMLVKVCGAYDVSSLALEAIKVVTLSAVPALPQPGIVEVAGNISAVTDSGFTLDIKQADYLPDVDAIEVAMTEATYFTRGDASQLAPGQAVEVKAMVNEDGSLSALLVEIEGAGSGVNAMYLPGVVAGDVISLVNDDLTILVRDSKGMQFAPGTELTVNIAQVFIKHGDRQLLVAGTPVTVKGLVVTDALMPMLVKINDSAQNTVTVKGVVEDVTGTLLTLQVIASDNSSITPMAQITLDISSAVVSGGVVADLGQTLAVVEVTGRIAENGSLVPQAINIKSTVIPSSQVCAADLTISGMVSELGGGILVLTGASGAAGSSQQSYTLTTDRDTVYIGGVQPALQQMVEVVAKDCISGLHATSVTIIAAVN